MSPKKHGNIPRSRSGAYEGVRAGGGSKEKAARIAWKGRTKKGRSEMAKKGARTKKSRRGR